MTPGVCYCLDQIWPAWLGTGVTSQHDLNTLSRRYMPGLLETQNMQFCKMLTASLRNDPEENHCYTG